MLRDVLLAAAKSPTLKTTVERAPVSRSVVQRFVAGPERGDAVAAVRRLAADGLLATIDHLGEDTEQRAQAEAVVVEYERLLDDLADAGLTGSAEVSVKLSAVGQALGPDGEQIALDHACRIAEKARAVGTTITLDMEDHRTTDSTLAVLGRLRKEYPDAGAVVQSYLRRTEADCRELAHEGSRVRLCKGAYDEPESVAYQDVGEVDKSYVRCLKVLMAGAGTPLVATHDPRLIEIAGTLATRHGRARGSYEYQLLYGIRPDEQRRLAGLGESVRVYIPYGQEWYGYLVRRLAERPANVAFFLRALVSTG